MSFQIDWAALNADHDLRTRIIEGVNTLLKEKVLTKIPGGDSVNITLSDLDFGIESPHLELLELKELSTPCVNVLFGFGYDGSMGVKFSISLEMNPMDSDPDTIFGQINHEQFGVLSADKPCNVQFGLSIVDFRLQGTVEINLSSTNNTLTISLHDQILKDIRIESTVLESTFMQDLLSNFIKKRLQSVAAYAKQYPIVIPL